MHPLIRIVALASALALLQLPVACSSGGGGDAGGDAGVTTPSDTASGGVDSASDAPVSDVPGFVDDDFDQVADDVDNCLGLFNPFQDDADLDGVGDLCDPDGGDRDGDRVPDAADLWPDEADMPGTVRPNTVYAHTSSELFYLGVKTLDVFSVGPFRWPTGLSGAQMTDIAVDRYGVLYGVTFGEIVTCHPGTGECTHLADLPPNNLFNGLTLIPRGQLSNERDVLIAMAAQGGGWWRFEIVGGNPQITWLGDYGTGYSSSGDAFSIENVGTFAALNKVGSGSDVLARLNPATGAVVQEVVTLTGFSDVFGLAGWEAQAYAFDESGAILIIDLDNNVVETTKQTPHAWWGAGVRTRLDP